MMKPKGIIDRSLLEVAMNTKNKWVARWPLLAGYLGIVVVILACASGGGTATPVGPIPTEEEAPLRLDNGAVEMRNENGDWMPIVAESTFELVGELQSTDPWMVTGNTFAVRESTHIAEGLEVGALVTVKGLILEDATWLASSIELAEEETDPTIILIGEVTSIDPWVVHGITLNVTSDTLISGEITPGMIVQVEILLLSDGTWEVISIAPLSDFTEIPGCPTVRATVVSANRNEIQFTGWPTITLGEDVVIENDQGGEGTLSTNQWVLLVVCASEVGQIVITHIIILDVDGDDAPTDGGKVLICHKPDKKGGHTLSVSSSAVPAHLAHGDKLGPCP
jgi:uncharacterized protein DUF5666